MPRGVLSDEGGRQFGVVGFTLGNDGIVKCQLATLVAGKDPVGNPVSHGRHATPRSATGIVVLVVVDIPLRSEICVLVIIHLDEPAVVG